MLFISSKKLFSFLRYLRFCPVFLQHDKRAMISFKFMTSQTGQQIITIYILPSISGSKDNQKIEFGQLIEYNMKNILLEKSYSKRGGEASPKPFYKDLKLSISLNEHSEIL